MTQTLRTVVIAIWTVAVAAQAQAHIITVADLPAGYATARLMPPFPGGLVPTGSLTEMFVNVQNTSLFDAKITAVGFNLPDDLADFTLTGTTSPAFMLVNDVAGVPGLGSASVDFALLTGGSFVNGSPGAGIAPGQTVSFSILGPFPAGFGFERILDFVVVRFEQAGPTGTASGIGFGPSAAVPEPSTLMLLSIAGAGYGIARRWKETAERRRDRVI